MKFTDKRGLMFALPVLTVLTAIFCISACADSSVNTPAPAVTVTPQGDEISIIESCILAEYAKCSDGHLTDAVKGLLTELRSLSPERADKWDELMEYWEFVNTEMTVNTDTCPDKLSKGKNLCIVVMGYHLTNAGTASRELKARLQTTLVIASKYPNAYIAVTGGPTASKNKRASEGAVMESWLINHGISPARIIVESDSMTTSENAVYTAGLLDKYPEITDLVIVTSDYHIRRSCLVFQTQMIMSGRKARVVSNYACEYGAHSGKDELSNQVSNVKQVLSITGNR